MTAVKVKRRNGDLPAPEPVGPVIPKNETAEKAAIACLLTDASPFSVPLSEAHFFYPDHQLIFAAVRDLAVKQQPINIITVRAMLEANGQLDKAGGDPSRFYEYVGGGDAVLDYYFHMLEEARKNREALLFINEKLEDLTKLRIDAKDFVRELSDKVNGHSNTKGIC